MSQQVDTIRGVFLIPLGVDVFLLFCLWVISLTAWVAAVFMAGIIMIKMLHFLE